MKSHLLILLCAALATALPQASAQKYPTKPIRLIVPISPGGGLDYIARAVSQKLADNLGQSIVVDNRGGASGTIAAEAARQADPDGYTLLMTSVSLVTRPLLYKVPYDMSRDFAPISQLSTQPYLLLMTNALPVKSVQELLAHARANPGRMNYASVGNGSQIHLMTELFRTLTGIQVVHVPYKGAINAYPDLIAGSVQFMFNSVTAGQPHVKAQRLRALAVSGPRRIGAFPDLPTVSEAGVKGFTVTQWYGLLAPAGTPRAIIEKLNAALRSGVETPEVRSRIAADGGDPLPSSPEEYAADIEREDRKWGDLIRKLKLRIE